MTNKNSCSEDMFSIAKKISNYLPYIIRICTLSSMVNEDIDKKNILYEYV